MDVWAVEYLPGEEPGETLVLFSSPEAAVAWAKAQRYRGNLLIRRFTMDDPLRHAETVWEGWAPRPTDVTTA